MNDARAMKAYPELREYIWQKDARMQPNGQYDKIGLHRLVKTGITPIGVIFMTDCPMWGAGEQHISNPPTDSWTKYENYSSAIYWANRGFDVYAIDYRTHFVPKDLNASQMSFAANWGWDVWISDIKEAANKVKEVSGSQKFYIEGQCSGGEAALNYATKYWKDDLLGIILLDANYPGAPNYPIVGRKTETNTYNMTKAISDMITAGNWSNDPFRNLRPIATYALQNPSASATNPGTGAPLNPPINPTTNKTWANITEWFSWLIHNNFGAATAPPGSYSNILGGYGNVSQDEFCLANSEFLPTRLNIENAAMADWVNCPNLTYDFNDHYNEIGVPVLAFQGPYTNPTGTVKFVQGTNNTDFTGNWMPKYGHLDFFVGTYSARDVSEPAYRWMINHTFPAITFSNGFEDGFNSWTATQGGASIATSPVHSGNYSMKCSNPWGSQATKSIAAQSKTYAEAQFYFSQDFAGSQSLIAFFDANGNPTVEMGLSVQSGKLFAYLQTNLPSYSYSQYPLLGLLPETWYKFALDASETSATIYLDGQQLADTSLPNIPATASVGVGMFWGDGSYKGNLYIDSVQIGDCAPKPVSASVFASGFEDGFNSWNKTYGGASVVSSPVYFGNYSMKCSGPMGSLATKSIGMQSGTLTEAEFYFDGNIAGSQTLIAYFNANGDPSVSMGISVQDQEEFLPSFKACFQATATANMN